MIEIIKFFAVLGVGFIGTIAICWTTMSPEEKEEIRKALKE